MLTPKRTTYLGNLRTT